MDHNVLTIIETPSMSNTSLILSSAIKYSSTIWLYFNGSMIFYYMNGLWYAFIVVFQKYVDNMGLMLDIWKTQSQKEK